MYDIIDPNRYSLKYKSHLRGTRTVKKTLAGGWLDLLRTHSSSRSQNSSPSRTNGTNYMRTSRGDTFECVAAAIYLKANLPSLAEQSPKLTQIAVEWCLRKHHLFI
jgi:hypothetical protein